MNELAWQVKVDGKRLLLAKPPFRIRVTVHDASGQQAVAEEEVRK